MISAPFRRPIQGAVAAGDAAANILASVPWVAQWKFNNDGNDSIGANNLTGVNTPTFTTGKLGGATGATQLVNTDNQYWWVASNANLQVGDLDFTIALWVYFDSKTPDPSPIIPFVTKVRGSGAANAWEYDVDYHSGVDRLRLVVSDGSSLGQAWANDLGAPAISTWYCIIAWHDSVANTVNICVNDGAVNSISWTTGVPVDTGSVMVGRLSNYYRFSGRIDNVCIAKSAAGGGGVLSAAQRTAFYNSGNGTEVLT